MVLWQGLLHALPNAMISLPSASEAPAKVQKRHGGMRTWQTLFEVLYIMARDFASKSQPTNYQPCLRILLTLLHSAINPSLNSFRHRSIRRFFFS